MQMVPPSGFGYKTYRFEYYRKNRISQKLLTLPQDMTLHEVFQKTVSLCSSAFLGLLWMVTGFRQKCW